MADKVDGRTYLIFGANGGIGSVVAEQLHRRGARLWLAGRDETALAGLADQVGGQALTVEATESDSIQAAVEQVVQKAEALDGVVNCFGTMLLKPAHLTSDEEWTETLAVNLTSSFAITRSVARAFPKEGGAVVFLSTVAARVGLPNHEAIAAAKAGLIGLALSAAATYAPRQIRYNVVAPGLVDTKLATKITSNEASLKASRQMHPLGRIGTASEVASAIVWFLDPAQSWVTGQVLGVDGGLGDVRGRATG